MTQAEIVERIAEVLFKQNFFGSWEDASDQIRFQCYSNAESLVSVVKEAGFEITEAMDDINPGV